MISSNSDDVYSIEASDNLILVILPQYDKYDVAFELEYYTDGELEPFYWQYYNQYFTGPNG